MSLSSASLTRPWWCGLCFPSLFCSSLCFSCAELTVLFSPAPDLSPDYSLSGLFSPPLFPQPQMLFYLTSTYLLALCLTICLFWKVLPRIWTLPPGLPFWYCFSKRILVPLHCRSPAWVCVGCSCSSSALCLWMEFCLRLSPCVPNMLESTSYGSHVDLYRFDNLSLSLSVCFFGFLRQDFSVALVVTL